MTFSESVEALETLNKADVDKLLRQHGFYPPLLLDEQEDLNTFAPPSEDGMRDAKRVLDWLGY